MARDLEVIDTAGTPILIKTLFQTFIAPHTSALGQLTTLSAGTSDDRYLDTLRQMSLSSLTFHNSKTLFVRQYGPWFSAMS